MKSFIPQNLKEEVESKGTGYMTVVDALEKRIPINIILISIMKEALIEKY